REIDEEGKGSGLGVVAGGVTGGIVGNQVGQGTGRDLATIAGVVGGAIAGNTIEKKIKKTRVYDVTVKMENGEERALRYKTVPGVAAGDKVKIEGGHIVRL
ncbi:MAG TPA: glycine zipper 2TM domain-containing protein, partial [Nitrospira sp.]|nr:glycine zipper 2TM domain-containing protein [Nitrospira sp.]